MSNPDLHDLLAFLCVQMGSQDIHGPHSSFELFEIFGVYLFVDDTAVVDRTRIAVSLICFCDLFTAIWPVLRAATSA